MADPIRQKNKRTGQTRVSHDGGKTWQIEEEIRQAGPAQAPADPKKEVQETLSDAAVGVGSGGLSDLDDEVAGGIEAIKAAFTDPTKRGQQAYVEGRDRYRARKDLAEERSPTANLAGRVGGGVAQHAAISAATGGTGTALRAAGQLAAEGAVQGFGASRAEGAQLAEDTVKGAGTAVALGGLTRKVIGGTGRQLQHFPRNAERFKRAGDKSAVSAAGINPGLAAQLPGGVEAQARRQRELGIGGPLASKDDIYEQATAAQGRVHAERTGLAGGFKRPISGHVVAARLRERASKMAPEAQADQIAQLESLAQRYEKRGDQGFDFWNNERAAWGEKANFASDSPQALVQQDVHRILNDSLEHAGNRNAAGAGTKWRDLGQQEHAAILARDGADDRLNREAANRVLSPSDQGVAMIAAHKAGIPAAAASGLANRVFRGRERSALAATQYGISKGYRTFSKPATTIGRVLERSAPAAGSVVGRAAAGRQAVQEAAQISDSEAAKAHYIESLTNPEYREEAMQ